MGPNATHSTCIVTDLHGMSQQPVQQYNPNSHKYCWTHGGCNHWGPECWRPTNGHQQGASFQNKIGGSVKNCV
eukprot:7373419-Ditylum_brightwellii.AAC.1